MQETELIQRIVVDPKVMAGRPVIKGTRLTVQYILGLLASRASKAEILAEYQDLSEQDIYACLAFAALVLEDAAFMPLVQASA
jgi:uncharacterized protein (DUF433 family)